ncbi:MAG: type II secretion system F family protein, partial [Roseburia sp.]|nr:type II secretion system F family protein [Roseburia sp.]
MANYKYEIVTPEGKARSGTIEAVNEETAQMLLRSEGNLIVSLSVASALEKDIDIHIGKAVKPRE